MMRGYAPVRALARLEGTEPASRQAVYRGRGRSNGTARAAASPGLLNRDARPFRLRLGRLGYADLQHAVAHTGLNVFRVHVHWQRCRAIEAPHIPLHSIVLVLVDFLFGARLALDDQVAVLQLDLHILL